MRVLVTRAEPAASKTAIVLKNHEHEPVLLPLFELAGTENPIPQSNFDCYIFTSGNALKILRDRQWSPANINVVAFCVGEKTASEARELGFSKVVSANGDAEALAALISSQDESQDSRFLYLAGMERSFDMQNALAPAGIDLHMVEVYDVIRTVPSREKITETLHELKQGYVFLYSRKTAEHVCEVVFNTTGSDSFPEVSAIAISSKTADAVLKYPWQDVYVADEPTEQSMVEKLNEIAFL